MLTYLTVFYKKHALLPGVGICGRLLFTDGMNFLNYVVSEIVELRQTGALPFKPRRG